MCIRSILVVCRVFVFCVLGVFLLSAQFDSYCSGNFCEKKYACEFKSGPIISVFFKKRYKVGLSEADILKAKKEVGYAGYTGLESGEPDYTLRFVIVGEHRGVNIKKATFDGVEAEPSIFYLYEPSVELGLIKDFQMGPSDFKLRFAKLIFPVPVYNVFEMRLRKPFVERLKAQDKFKITLISTYDKEFVLETDNFIREYDF
ncbi:hypothetical protein bcCo53_001195 (plasmid) [Borrelia coriaceae]|nr:hypothetical protein [Borrelia coriaceae]UPA17026.1 hypothetical protein bcCo53_001195 [Borrelia coriaceae]